MTKLTPSEMILAKRRAALRAPILSLLTRRLSFARLHTQQVKGVVIYRTSADDRVLSAFVRDTGKHSVYVSRVGHTGDAQAEQPFSNSKEELLFAVAAACLCPLPAAVEPMSQPVPAFDLTATQGHIPAAIPAAAPPSWPPAPAQTPIHWGDKNS